jgi:4-hydroxy-4-methyl-2-oxoglutarate aldolase
MKMTYSKEMIEKFHSVASASVADAVDLVVGKTGYMDFEIKPRINDKKVVGPAVTVKEVATNESFRLCLY